MLRTCAFAAALVLGGALWLLSPNGTTSDSERELAETEGAPRAPSTMRPLDDQPTRSIHARSPSAAGGLPIAGVVRGELGVGVPGAEIVVVDRPATAVARTPRRLATDEAGWFRLPPVFRPGPVRLKVSADGYGDATVEVEAGDEKAVLDLLLPGEIRGTVSVRDASEASAIVVKAERSTPQGPSPSEVRVDPDGSFRVRRRPGTYALHAERGESRGDIVSVVMPRGGTVEGVNLKAPSPPTRGIVITGRVVDGRGQPVAGTTVMGTQFDWAHACPSRHATTDAEGRFELLDCGSTTYRVFVWADNGFSEAARVAAGTGGIELHFLRSGSIRGSVVTSDDDPPPRGHVVAVSGEKGSRQLIAEASFDTFTKDAAFRLPKVPPGTCRVAVRWGRWVGTTDGDLGIREGQETEAKPIRLVVGATIKGTLRDAVGTRGSPSTVYLETDAGVHDEDTPDGNGAFEFHGLPTCRATVWIFNPVADGRVTADVDVECGQAFRISLDVPSGSASR